MSQATIRIGRDEHVWSFDAQREPVVRVHVGDVIEIETWDCFTGQRGRAAHGLRGGVETPGGRVGVQRRGCLHVHLGYRRPRPGGVFSSIPGLRRRAHARAQAGVESWALPSLIS